MGIAIFRDFPAFEHLKAIAFKELGPASRLESHNLPVNLSHSFAPQVLKIAVHESAGTGQTLNFGQHIEMEMGAASWGRGDFTPGISQNPSYEITRRFIVERIFRHTPGKEGEVVEEIEELLPKGTVGAEQIPFDHAVVLQHEGGLGLNIRVVSGQIIGKNLAILKNRVDGLAQKAGFTTQESNRGTIF